MSIGSELRFDAMIEDHIRIDRMYNAYSNRCWLTKDGRCLFIADMDLDHILNIVRFLINNPSFNLRNEYIRLFKEEYFKRGDLCLI